MLGTPLLILRAPDLGPVLRVFDLPKTTNHAFQSNLHYRDFPSRSIFTVQVKSLGVFGSAMGHSTRALPPAIRSKMLRLLLLNWRPDAIAQEVHCHVTTVYRMQENMLMYGSPMAPHRRQEGRPRKMCQAAEESLTEYLTRHPTASHKELQRFLREEWTVIVSLATVSRAIKRQERSR